jgi:hypothetical protein
VVDDENEGDDGKIVTRKMLSGGERSGDETG